MAFCSCSHLSLCVKNNAEGLLYPRRIIGISLFFCKKINAAKGFSTSFRIYFKTLRCFPIKCFPIKNGRRRFSTPKPATPIFHFPNYFLQNLPIPSQKALRSLIIRSKHLLRRALLDDESVCHEDHAVGDIFRKRHLMGNNHHRDVQIR